MSDGYRRLGIRQAEATDAKEVWFVNYRLAPQHVYPAALDDAMAVYEALLKRGTKAKDIIVFGDSAGGNLAVELALRLKAEKKPQPGLLLLASPWADLRTTPASRTTNRDRDLVLGPVNKFMYEAVLKLRGRRKGRRRSPTG